MAMFDNMLMLLDSSADVTSNVTGQAIDFHGEDTKELYYRIVVKIGEFDCRIYSGEADTHK